MRRLPAVVGLGLTVAFLAACGGPPTDASEEDFCEAYNNLEAAGDDFDESMEAVEELADVGTPEDIPDGARAGFETVVDLAQDANDEDETREALQDLSGDERAEVDEFFDYADETC